MFARVSTFQGSPDRLEQGARADAEELRRTPGSRRAFALADRESGGIMLITLWESEAALRESAERADGVRGRLAREVGAAGAPVVRVFEVVAELEGLAEGERR
jgi:heme-degrading monooxygenase HmoA